MSQFENACIRLVLSQQTGEPHFNKERLFKEKSREHAIFAFEPQTMIRQRRLSGETLQHKAALPME